MASNSTHRTHRTLGAKSSRRLGVLGCLALAWVASCSFRNLDELGPGESAGGKSSAGGAGNQAGGNTGGAANLNGGTTAAGGVATPTAGGAGGGTQGGTTATGGTIATGGTTGKQLCPVYTSPSGTLVTPPSNDFENEALEWSTTNEHPFSNTLVADPDGACVGKQYLSSDGASRIGASDGPGVDVVNYVTAGHLYTLNLAVRFSSKESNAMGAVKITVARACKEDTVTIGYAPLATKQVGTTWNRVVVAQPFGATLQGCTALRKMFIYVETEGTENAARTIEVDDFQLWDMTATGAGGAGGGAGAAGAAGAAGTAGAAGRG